MLSMVDLFLACSMGRKEEEEGRIGLASGIIGAQYIHGPPSFEKKILLLRGNQMQEISNTFIL